MRTPELLIQGIAEYNAGDLFRCHTTLESLWRLSRGEARRFVQGMIQSTMGLHHAMRGNIAGSLRLLDRGMAKLDGFAGDFAGIELGTFRRELHLLRDRIGENLESEGFALEPGAVPRIEIIPEPAE